MIVENKRNTTAIVKITECLGLLNYRSKLKPSFCNFLRPSSKHYQHVLRCFHAEPKLFCSLVTGDLYENLRKPNYKLYMLIVLDEWKIVTRILIFIPSRQMIPMDDTIYIECSQEKFKRSKEWDPNVNHRVQTWISSSETASSVLKLASAPSFIFNCDKQWKNQCY